MSAPFAVSLDGARSVTALLYSARGPKRGTLILAHGAGANQSHPFMVRAATGIAERGVETITFNFLYAEAKRRVPDPLAKLETCFRAVVQEVAMRSGEARLFLGGKSMGGRIASHLAATGDHNLAGLILLGYPLHPPGRPKQPRSGHLSRITAPMLFVQGTRDTFGTPEELRPVVAAMRTRVTICGIPDGDHSFKVRKQWGRSEDQVWDAVLTAIEDFVREGESSPESR